jgi:hypothetical protein
VAVVTGQGDGEEASPEARQGFSAVIEAPTAPHPAELRPFTLLLLPDLPEELEATFGWSGLSPARARRFVTDGLVAWGCADLIEDAAVIVSELATNAIIHAQTAFTVALSRRSGGRIRIAVADTSPVRPRPRHAGPRDASGRGLSLVEALSVRWGTDLVPGGKVVWADVDEARVADRSRRPGAALISS